MPDYIADEIIRIRFILEPTARKCIAEPHVTKSSIDGLMEFGHYNPLDMPRLKTEYTDAIGGIPVDLDSARGPLFGSFTRVTLPRRK